MTLQEEVKSLPLEVFKALLEKRFFDYAQLSERKEMIQNYINMNLGESRWQIRQSKK